MDGEKVIKGLECCASCNGESCGKCPYQNESHGSAPMCTAHLAGDALALLKEQEAREPHYTTLKYLVGGTEVVVRHPECPRCIENGLMLWDAEIEKGWAFCKRCGQGGEVGMTREEKKELLKIARQRITDAGNKGKKKRYHVEDEYGDKGWMDYSKGIVDAVWAIDELIEDVDRSDD